MSIHACQRAGVSFLNAVSAPETIPPEAQDFEHVVRLTDEISVLEDLDR